MIDTGGAARDNPLNDPLNDLSSGGEEDAGDVQQMAGTGIVPQLKAQAAHAARLPKKPRKPSQREGEWITRLVERWGEDYKGMARDRKLNAMQQSEGDLRRRVRRWRELGTEGEGA